MANQSTQVVQKPTDLDNRPAMPTGNTALNLNKDISLVFNKEENLLEDKRRKDDLPENCGNIVVTYCSKNTQENNSSVQSVKDEEISKPAFLGTIYKELYEKRAVIEKTKSLSHTDRDSVLNEIVDRIVGKNNESKSAPSIQKLIIGLDNEENPKDWALNLASKKDKGPGSASTSGSCK